MRRPHTLAASAAVALAIATPARSVAAQAAAALAESMWAAQTEARTIRLVWNHLPKPITYTISCEVGTRPARTVGTVTAGVPTPKDAYSPPPRLGTIVGVVEPGVAHRCFLQWAADPKGPLSPRLPFNEVTPIVPTAMPNSSPVTVAARSTGLGEITVTWSEVPGATGYVIGRSIAPDGFRTYCDLCSTRTTVVDRLARPGMQHRYTVTAATPAGPAGRGVSAAVLAPKTADAVTAQSDPQVAPSLKRPSTVTATISGPASVRVTWGGVPGAAGYEVLRSVNRGTMETVGRVAAGPSGAVVEYPDYLGSFLSAGSNQVSARYAVKSVDASGARTAPETSNEVTIDNKAAGDKSTTSTNASNTRATATSASSVSLTWSPPAAGIPCALTRSLSGGAYAALPPLAAGTWQYVDNAPGLAERRPQYRITCGDAKSLSQPVSFPTVRWATFTGDGAGASSAATVPTNLRATATSAESVTLTWGPPTDPLACALRRSVNGGAYATLRSFPIGTWHYVDTAAGLREMRARYQMACGNPKLAKVVSFPSPF